MRHLWRHRRDVDEDGDGDGDEGEGEDRDEVAGDYKKQQGQRKAAHRLGSTGCHLVSGPETEKETQFDNENENETEARLRRCLRLVSFRLRPLRFQGLTLSVFCVTLSIFSVK